MRGLIKPSQPALMSLVAEKNIAFFVCLPLHSFGDVPLSRGLSGTRVHHVSQNTTLYVATVMGLVPGSGFMASPGLNRVAGKLSTSQAGSS